MKNIRTTLLRSLFFDTPPYMGNLLEDNANRVFPGRDGFIRFLEETDSQKRTKQARSLVMRLSRESGLFIPTRLLFSLLEAEEQYAPGTATKSYVPQDHFAHLIHLYLLGIYIFTHHKKFNRTLCLYFERLRQEKGHVCALNSDEAAFGDFLYSWRAFVLLHDIAYPHELSMISSNSLLKHIRNRYVSFLDEVADETAISFLSQMAAWQLTDEMFPPLQLKTVASVLFVGDKYDRARDLFDTVNVEKRRYDSTSWQNAVRVPLLHGRRFLQLLQSICPKERILAVLIHSRSGEVSLALVPERTNTHRVIQIDNKFKLELFVLLQHAFEHGTTPRLMTHNEEYEWQFFVLDYDKAKARFMTDLAGIVNRYLDGNLIVNVSRGLANEAPSTLATITSDADFREYDYWLHEKLQLWLHGNKQNIPKDVTNEHSVVAEMTQSLEQDIANRISGYLQKRIEGALADGSPRGDDTILALGIEAIVAKAIEPIQKDTSLAEELGVLLKGELQTKIDQELSRRNVVDDLRRIARELVPDARRDLAHNTECFDWRKTLTSVDKESEKLNLLLQKSSLPPLSELLEKYSPDYLSKGSLDHGLAGTLFVLQTEKTLSGLDDALRASSQKPTDRRLSALARFARIALCLGDDTSQDDLSYRTSTLLPEVGRAVAVHNLYPKYMAEFNKTDFRVSLRREPFCFFSMLMDTLQCWDRDRRIWQSSKTVPQKTLGDNYNITVRGDIIYVDEHDYDLDIGKRADALRNGLESFMRGAGDFIKLDLGQWKES